jgi:putative cofactor-binding repeat protein
VSTVTGCRARYSSLIEHCQANNVADFGTYLANGNGTRVVGCRMLQHVAGASPSTLGAEKAGIKIGNAEAAVVDGCRAEGFQKEGIYLGEATDGAIRCKVVHSSVKDVEGAGIYLTFEAERCAVIGNTVENAGNGVAAYGIYVEGDRNVVQGNDVVPHDQVPPPAVQAGIRLGGQAAFCIVTGNQTNGVGVSVADAATNTVESNRDDG